MYKLKKYWKGIYE